MPLSYNRTVKNFIWLLLLIFLSMGCGSQGADPAGKEGNLSSIKGVVTAASTITFKANLKTFKVAAASGTVTVPGAVCTIEGTDKSAITDANGFFQITDVVAGSYILICKKTASDDGKVYAFLEIVEVQDGETVDLGTMDIKKTGSMQGNAILVDETDHTGISVYIPGTSMQARTDATGAYLINNVPEGNYEFRFEISGYVTASLNNVNVTSGETTVAGDISITISTGATGYITIENGKVYSNSRTVTVSITASHDAVLYQISENPNFIGSVWNPIPLSRSWIFESDGEKRLYIKFADANGLESAPVSDGIIIDTTPPANGSIVINNSASATNSSTVTLTISAIDATTSVSQMKVSNNHDFTDSSWETFASQRSFTIPSGDGNKTVYIKFRDVANNETDAVSATIILDTTMPDSPSMTIQEGAYTNNSQIHLSLSASGASLVKISEDPNLAGISPSPYETEVIWDLSSGDGNKTIYVKFIDEAGNETAPLSTSIILDTISPTMPVIFNNAQTTNQAIFEVTLSTGSADANFSNYQLKGGQYSDWTDTADTNAFGFTLTQQGQNVLSIRGKDKAGNTGNSTSVIISLDTDKPVMSDIKALGAVTYVTITWKTDEPTTGKVDLGLNENYGTTIGDNFTTDHTVTINDLTAGTLYHYRIISIDGSGNVTVSTDMTLSTIKVTAIAASGWGGWHTCALTTSGGVKCWGNNDNGQLGDGTKTSRLTPVDVSGLSSGIIAVTSGTTHTCALTTSGGVKCWGKNDNGQLGDGTETSSLTPAEVSGLSSGVIAISAGSKYTCALTTTGGIKCWGYNYYGQLGDGTTTSRLTPEDVSGLSSGVIAVSAGDYHTCALTTTEGIKCWGNNNYGQLGNDTTSVAQLTPVDVSGFSTGGITVSAGSYHTCALTTSGGVKCWGFNGGYIISRSYGGLLGDGTTIERHTPVDVLGLSTGVISVAVGGLHTCALTTSGGIKCWGNNSGGQLGDGTTTSRLTPVDVSGLSSDIIAISGGDGIWGIVSHGGYTCAVTASGGVKCWGKNSRGGSLGDGTTIDRPTPVDVIGLH